MVGQSEFWADLRTAWRATWSAPMLPILSVLLILPGEVASLFPAGSEPRQGLEQLSILVAVFGVGWYGTQRIWYQRLFERRRLDAEEVWRLTWLFFGRFFVLGVIVVVAPALIFVLVLLATEPPSRNHPFVLPFWLVPAFLAYSLVLDVALTFVTPALAYTTKRVRGALSIGVRMIVEKWPRSAAYTLVPPITLLAFVTVSPIGLPPLARVLLGILATLVGLVVKGAIAAFYLREHVLRTADTAGAVNG